MPKMSYKGDYMLAVMFEVKKSLESDYPRPKAVAFRPIHDFATAIYKAFSRHSPMTLTPPRGRGFQKLSASNRRRKV